MGLDLGDPSGYAFTLVVSDERLDSDLNPAGIALSVRELDAYLLLEPELSGTETDAELTPDLQEPPRPAPVPPLFPLPIRPRPGKPRRRLLIVSIDSLDEGWHVFDAHVFLERARSEFAAGGSGLAPVRTDLRNDERSSWGDLGDHFGPR